jgi:uncharacterized PurR-regulated membrane protein YhhQ (DUF165 family)
MNDIDGVMAAGTRGQRPIARRAVLCGFIVPVLAALAAAVFVTAANAGECCEGDGADTVAGVLRS